jgi:diguanylate cyclase (GGDEF)-like protein
MVRGARLAALFAGIAVLAASVITSILTARDQLRTSLDHELTVGISQEAAAIEESFTRSRAGTLLLTHNPVFGEFYVAPGGLYSKIDAGGRLTGRLHEALSYLEKLYPGAVGEVCFIDSSGVEIARVVDGKAAARAELSPDESRQPFFGPTVAQGVGEVYQSRPYVSPDTHDWVVSNSTRMALPSGESGIVHFETRLETFRSAGRHEAAVSVVDATTGTILVDSRNPSADGRTLGRPGDRTFVPVTTAGRAQGMTTIGDRRVAYRRIPALPGNANDWYVVVSHPVPGAGWTHGIGLWSVVLMAGALATIAVALVSLRSYQRSLRRAALHDPLTGLPNRVLLTDRLGAALDAARADGGRTAVMVVDLDRFKEVNDTLGHHFGDQLLLQTAERMQLTLRGVDTVARLGGDEFAVVMPQIADAAAVQAVAERLLGALHHSFVVEGLTLDVEASIGLAISPDHGAGPDELLRHADAAMYEAKEHRTGYVLYDRADTDRAPTRLALLGDLRRALDADDQITLHYQPKVDLACNELVGVEALIRWQHPTRGMLPPNEFIPVAESTALIQRLTLHVLELALEQVRSWRDGGLDVPVAVNLSTRCLLDAGFPAKVFQVLSRLELPPSVLHLEVTESSIMADPARALSVLRTLHGGGIRLSIDDFGTGYSSMSYLKQLPVDELKVDRSFVTELNAVASDAVLVRSVIDLGHNLGLAVVAEGVEDEQALDTLRSFGCDIAQGYHLGRPMPAARLHDWLHARSLLSVVD